MICEINVESVVLAYFEVAGPGNELGFAQNSFKSTLFSVDTYILCKTLFEFDM